MRCGRRQHDFSGRVTSGRSTFWANKHLGRAQGATPCDQQASDIHTEHSHTERALSSLETHSSQQFSNSRSGAQHFQFSFVCFALTSPASLTATHFRTIFPSSSSSFPLCVASIFALRFHSCGASPFVVFSFTAYRCVGCNRIVVAQHAHRRRTE